MAQLAYMWRSVKPLLALLFYLRAGYTEYELDRGYRELRCEFGTRMDRAN